MFKFLSYAEKYFKAIWLFCSYLLAPLWGKESLKMILKIWIV